MKMFHISDVLSVTTGRLVSSRHMDGIYEILNFLTGDNLFTHQLPRAMDTCKPWLRTQFPSLMEDAPGILLALEKLDTALQNVEDYKNPSRRKLVIEAWVEAIRMANGLPEMIPLYELPADIHTRIDPVAELEAMVGKDRVIVVEI